MQPHILQYKNYKQYVDYFNTMETENIKQAISNDSAWWWMQQNIPLFDCPQKNFTEMYYYRWWTFRKHIKNTEQGTVITEFLVQRSYADKYNLIASGLGHHIYESRWLHNSSYMDNNMKVWYRGNDGKPLKKLRFYSSWNIDALYNRFLVNNDTKFIDDLLPDLENDYMAWEADKKNAKGLYWQFDVRDAMEETISGGRKEKNPRPSINAYMYGNANALRQLNLLQGNGRKAFYYQQKMDSIKTNVQNELWNTKHNFFEVRKEQGDTLSNAREAIGFLPWYVNMPDAKYNAAWQYLQNEKHFTAPFGITTAERCHPAFRTHGCCNCEWDGAVWPFATAQTLTAMANVLNNYQQNFVSTTDYFNQLEKYVNSQYYDNLPYIGEYLDEKTGKWLKEKQERSRYYNHSTFNDLIISGLIGLRPRLDDTLEINPLVPKDKWKYFCLDNVKYHGKKITIVWDSTGKQYKKGKGFLVFVNGKKKIQTDKLKKVTTTL